MKFNVLMVSSVDKSLMNETCLLLLWVGMLVTLQTFVFIHLTNMVRPVHVFMVRKRISKNYSRAELFFQRIVHFGCVPIYNLGFHYKQCASDKKDFTFVKVTAQIIISTDQFLKEKTHPLLLQDGLLVTLQSEILRKNTPQQDRRTCSE